MSSRDSNHSTLLFSEHSVCVHANCLSDLVFPQQINDLAVSIPPRLVKLHKYFVVCSKPKPLDGVQLVQREGGLEKTGTLLLQVPWPKRSHWRTSHTVKKNSSKNIFIKDIILLCFLTLVVCDRSVWFVSFWNYLEELRRWRDQRASFPRRDTQRWPGFLRTLRYSSGHAAQDDYTSPHHQGVPTSTFGWGPQNHCRRKGHNSQSA